MNPPGVTVNRTREEGQSLLLTACRISSLAFEQEVSTTTLAPRHSYGLPSTTMRAIRSFAIHFACACGEREAPYHSARWWRGSAVAERCRAQTGGANVAFRREFRTVVTDGTTVLTASSDVPAVRRPCGAFTGMRTHTHAAQPPPLACWVRHGKRWALCMIHAVNAHHPLAPPLASAVSSYSFGAGARAAKGKRRAAGNGVRLKETSQ